MLTVNGIEYGSAQGTSKNAARERAARAAYEEVTKRLQGFELLLVPDKLFVDAREEGWWQSKSTFNLEKMLGICESMFLHGQ